MIHVVAFFIAVFFCWRLISRFQLRSATAWAVCIGAILVSQHHLVTRNFFGSMASPEIPAAVIMTLGWLFGTLLLGACFFLILDLLGLFSTFTSRNYLSAVLRARSASAATVLLATTLSAVGVWQAVKSPAVRTVEIEFEKLPQALDGFKLVQLTDLHASRLLQRRWMEQVVSTTNALQPGLVVITGDFADGSVAARENDVAPLQKLSATHGVYSIVGNHEYYTEYQAWQQHLQDLGLRLLLNSHARIKVANSSIVIAGITDPVAERFDQVTPNALAALKGVPADDFTVLLSHRPGTARQNAPLGVALQLSGHTHGGQVLGLHWITQLANQGYVSGLYDVDTMKLYVSNGTGLWNGFPLRLGRSSEITQIILRTRRDQV